MVKELVWGANMAETQVEILKDGKPVGTGWRFGIFEGRLVPKDQKVCGFRTRAQLKRGETYEVFVPPDLTLVVRIIMCPNDVRPGEVRVTAEILATHAAGR